MERKNMLLKFVPFIMRNFADYVQKHNFVAEYYYLQTILESKPQDKKIYNIIDLIQIFNCKQLKNIQLLWKLFLRIEAQVTILEKVYSKRVQVWYQNKLIELIQQVQAKMAYRKYINIQLIIEGLEVNDPKYNHLKQNDDIRIPNENYPENYIQFKFNIFRILANLQKFGINEPKKRLNNFLVIVDVVKHFNKIEDLNFDKAILSSDQNISFEYCHKMSVNQINDRI